jgi:hypothetical protein
MIHKKDSLIALVDVDRAGKNIQSGELTPGGEALRRTGPAGRVRVTVSCQLKDSVVLGKENIRVKTSIWGHGAHLDIDIAADEVPKSSVRSTAGIRFMETANEDGYGR